MFSGIVQHLGSVREIQHLPEFARLQIESEAFSEAAVRLNPIKLGDSIAISGVCLTVTEFDPLSKVAFFDVGSETLRRSTMGNFVSGTVCHIERSLRLGDSLDGHLVFGHVDATTALLETQAEGDTQRLRFQLPQPLKHLFAEKGSVSLNGVSLTLGTIEDDSFSVYLIPHTLQKTMFASLHPGDEVNLEVDMLARYVARILQSGVLTCSS